MSDTVEEKLEKIKDGVVSIDKKIALLQKDITQIKDTDIPKITKIQECHEERIRKVENKQAQILPIIAAIASGIGIVVSAVVGFFMNFFGNK